MSISASNSHRMGSVPLAHTFCVRDDDPILRPYLSKSRHTILEEATVRARVEELPTLQQDLVRQVHVLSPRRSFAVMHKIGSGSESRIYQAVELTKGKLAALALLKPISGKSVLCVQPRRVQIPVFQGLARETLYGISVQYEGREGTMYGYYMRYYNRGDLKHMIHEIRALPLIKKMAIALRLLRAVAKLHSEGIFHGDLHLKNILVHQKKDKNYICDIADFGAADKADKVSKYCVGTPRTMSPALLKRYYELKQGAIFLDNNEVIGLPADCWAIGCILHQLFKGDLPWQSCALDSKDMLELVCTALAPVAKEESLNDRLWNKLIVPLLSQDREARMTASLACDTLAGLLHECFAQTQSQRVMTASPPSSPPEKIAALQVSPRARAILEQSTILVYAASRQASSRGVIAGISPPRVPRTWLQALNPRSLQMPSPRKQRIVRRENEASQAPCIPTPGMNRGRVAMQQSRLPSVFSRTSPHPPWSP